MLVRRIDPMFLVVGVLLDLSLNKPFLMLRRIDR